MWYQKWYAISIFYNKYCPNSWALTHLLAHLWTSFAQTMIENLKNNCALMCVGLFSIQRYAVIPLSTNSGLIGWVPHCDTLHALIRDYREKKKILLNIEHRIMLRVSTTSMYYISRRTAGFEKHNNLRLLWSILNCDIIHDNKGNVHFASLLQWWTVSITTGPSVDTHTRPPGRI